MEGQGYPVQSEVEILENKFESHWKNCERCQTQAPFGTCCVRGRIIVMQIERLMEKEAKEKQRQ